MSEITPSSIEPTTPTPQMTEVHVQEGDFLTKAPMEFRTSPWAQNVMKAEDPQAEIWTQFGNLQSLLGKRPGGMPSDDASPEEWANWSQSVAPRDTSVYGDIRPQLPEAQGHLKEIIDGAYQQDMVAGLLETARSLGIPKYQMQKLSQKLGEYNVQIAQQIYDAQQAEMNASNARDTEQNAHFAELLTQAFGNDYSAHHQAGTEFVRAHIPPSLIPVLETLPNEALTIICGLAHSVKSKYGMEDRFPGGAGATLVVQDRDQLSADLLAVSCSPEYQDPFNPQHKVAQQKFNNIAAQLAKRTDFSYKGDK